MNRNQKSGCCPLVVITACCLLLVPAGFCGETPVIWENLEPGPYAIGFETIEEYDYSRTFGPRTDYFGEPLEGERARPIQICIWYPAEESADAVSMVYGEYAFPFPGNADFMDMLSTLQGRELGMLFYFTANNRALVHDLIDLEMAAVRDAPRLDGSFPLIVYHPGIRSSYCQNAILCEYLASHGFIVATTHPVGTDRLNAAPQPADLETGIRDREFAAARMRGYPNLATGSYGVFGFAFGGGSALIHAMRNCEVAAVVSLQGSFVTADQQEIVSGSPFYNVQTMGAPFLQIATAGGDSLDLSLVDSLKYCSRYILEFNGMNPTDFTIYGLFATMVPDSVSRASDRAREGYEVTCRYVLNFFKAHLNGDETAEEYVSRSPADNDIDPEFLTHRFMPMQVMPPTSDQFIAIVRDHGVGQAKELDEKYNLSVPENPILDERAFQALGYHFLHRGNTADAIELFMMSARAWPNSANSWDCLGEAYMANGDNELALENYRKALEIMPSDTTTSEQFKEVIRNGATARIQELEQLISGQTAGDQDSSE